MVDTILFDLDGTLLRFKQEEFIESYFAKLAKVFAAGGMDVEKSIKAIWAGTRAMMLNDGSNLNIDVFWKAFAEFLGADDEEVKNIEASCDEFYLNEFNLVKSIVEHSDIPKKLVKKMKQKGYSVVLATNPLFPQCGVISRLGWGEMEESDFLHITHYGNSSFCKPNLGYFREILDKIGKAPEQCLMVGNNPAEDMIAGELGMETFLVTDCVENESDIDITMFRRGSLEELEGFLLSLPDVK